MLETERLAREDPEAVREFAQKCDDPLKSRLLAIVERTEGKE